MAAILTQAAVEDANMGAQVRFLLSCLCAAALLLGASATTYEYNFYSDLEGMTSHRQIWKWSDGNNIDLDLPPGTNGAALYEIVPGGTVQADELYALVLDSANINSEIQFSILACLTSEYDGGTTLQVQRIGNVGGIDTFGSYTDSNQYRNTYKWYNGTITAPATAFEHGKVNKFFLFT